MKIRKSEMPQDQIEISNSQHFAKIWKKQSNLLQQDLNTSSKYCNYFINKIQNLLE